MKGIAALFAALCIVRPHAKESEELLRVLDENRKAGKRVQRSLAFLREVESTSRVLDGLEGAGDVGSDDS